MNTDIKPSKFNSIPRQATRLDERHKAEPNDILCAGIEIRANRGVYATSGDSELMIETVEITSTETFLEVGCGTGVVSIALSKRAFSGVGVDINDLAVENSKFNAGKHNVSNVQFYQSNVFQQVHGVFDIIICNPPYTKHEVSDNIDRMFWDPNDEMKQIFFKEAGKYLKPNGKVYFGWANFADIDVNLPLELAKENRFELVRTTSKPHPRNEFSFFVLEFRKL